MSDHFTSSHFRRRLYFRANFERHLIFRADLEKTVFRAIFETHLFLRAIFARQIIFRPDFENKNFRAIVFNFAFFYVPKIAVLMIIIFMENTKKIRLRI